MPELQYGLNSIERSRGNLPEVPVINLFVEKSDAEPNPILQSRPGLVNNGVVLGSGPVKALYHIDGVLSGQLFGVSNSYFYANGINMGAVSGTGHAVITGFSNRVFVCAGQDVFEYDGTTYSQTTTPGAFQVTSICVGTDRLILIDKNTGHFYWSDVLSDNVQALSFATAEQSPDNLKDCLFIGDTLHLFGSETIEFWPASVANPDLPFTPLIGRTTQVGIRDTGCCCTFAGTFAWITNTNRVCVGAPNNEISTPSLEEKLTNSATASLWKFYLEGIEFLAVRLDTETWIFNTHSSLWSTFESYGQTNWIPQCYANNTFGSSANGSLINWSSDYSDFGGQLERRFRAGLPITNASVPIYNLTLRTNPGHTPYLTGTYANPTVECRTSRDGGYNWSNWKSRSFGAEGQYRTATMWRSIGFFGFPSFMVEFRITDPVPFRVSGATINENYGGI